MHFLLWPELSAGPELNLMRNLTNTQNTWLHWFLSLSLLLAFVLITLNPHVLSIVSYQEHRVHSLLMPVPHTTRSYTDWWDAKTPSKDPAPQMNTCPFEGTTHHCPYHGLNVFILPKFVCWSPDAQCGGLRRWSLWEDIRVRWCHESKAFTMG